VIVDVTGGGIAKWIVRSLVFEIGDEVPEGAVWFKLRIDGGIVEFNYFYKQLVD